jgi:teichuronic acid biosynthesis glycosyltransferase TuaC
MQGSETKSLVLMVVPGDLKDGVLNIRSFVRSQAESLRQAGWEVVFGLVDNRTSIRGILRNVRRLKKEIVQAKPLLVHAQYGSVTLAVASMIKGQLPLVASFGGDDLLGTPAAGLYWHVRGRLARIVGLWVSRWAASIIVKSHNLLQALPAKMRSKAVVVPNGVDTSWFAPMSRDLCRATLGWNTKSKVVLFHVGLNEDQHRKNPKLARAAIQLLSRSVSDVSLIMISDSTQEQVRLMLNAADCLLVTSLHEGSPNIVKEAMACNLPIVSVPCGDVAERLKGVCPGSIRSYDPCALAQGMQEVLAIDCRSNGRDQLFEQGLTANKVAEHLIQIYLSSTKEQHFSRPANQHKVCVE